MSEEKRMILEMLNNGDINVDEAERLLSAIPNEDENTAVVTSNRVGVHPKKLKVTVTDNYTGKTNIDMRIPFSLIKAGLKIGKASIALGAKYDNNQNSETQQILELLRDVDIDEILGSLDDGDITLPYTMVDIDSNEDGKSQHIEIIME